MSQSLSAALTIAGSDTIGGAGIQADLKVFALLGVHGLSVLTALTAQNTLGVRAIHVPPLEFLQAQLQAVFEDIPPQAIKTGMLANEAIIQVITGFLAAHGQAIPLIVDPVLVAATGARLIDAAGERALRGLFSRATLITPNLHEAAALAATPNPTRMEEMENLLRSLAAQYPGPAWLLKGGHADWQGSQVHSLLLYDGQLHTFSHPRVDLTRPPHGTGCTLASAITALMAQGYPLLQSVEKGLQFTYYAVEKSHPQLGKGAQILNLKAAAQALFS